MHDTNQLPDQDPSLAERCAERLYRQDAATRALGMEVIEIAPGHAVLSMTVQPWMLNGHHSCHGGMIFSLADSAFAFACNSENAVNVAAGCTIDYLKPGRQDDRLCAHANRVQQQGRTGVYDVRVENQQGELIALFRGRSHRLPGSVLPGNAISDNAISDNAISDNAIPDSLAPANATPAPANAARDNQASQQDHSQRPKR